MGVQADPNPSMLASFHDTSSSGDEFTGSPTLPNQPGFIERPASYDLSTADQRNITSAVPALIVTAATFNESPRRCINPRRAALGAAAS
jgi:hypothetical protein